LRSSTVRSRLGFIGTAIRLLRGSLGYSSSWYCCKNSGGIVAMLGKPEEAGFLKQSLKLLSLFSAVYIEMTYGFSSSNSRSRQQEG
jgi:hypothetical protein